MTTDLNCYTMKFAKSKRKLGENHFNGEPKDVGEGETDPAENLQIEKGPQKSYCLDISVAVEFCNLVKCICQWQNLTRLSTQR